ncbi:unnamed protein product [Urochloa humidicola]
MTLSVSKEIRKLQDYLKYFDSIREDADARAMEHRATGVWWSDVNDVMYDVDDILDLLRANSQKQRCCDVRVFSRFVELQFDHMIAGKIKSVNERLVEIQKNREMFISPVVFPQIPQINGVNGHVATSVDEIEVVGAEIKEAADNMVELIVGYGHQSRISVYGILGMGGIGKTTLAQKIYNDRRIRARFPHVLIWLSISESVSETDLLKEAIEKTGGQSNQQKSKDQLVQVLLDSIRGKSVFLVLDNVTSSNVWCWDNLLCSPMERCLDAHVVVTTRSHDVLSQMNAVHVKEMHKLRDPDALELLMKRSFRTKDEINVFSDVGAKIVRKCDGLPLAIKVIGGVLSSRSSKEEWERILESRWSVDGLPKDLEGPLYLSYSDLSPQLKQCFLWCSLLPQNFNIHRDATYWWIAEGFVKEEGNGPIHNVAEDYYHELIKRNLLQARPEYIDKGVSTMHDLLRSLGQYLSRNEAVLMNEKDRCPSTSIRRLVIGNAVEEIPSIEAKKRLRCLIVLHHDTCRSVKKDIFRKLVHLRILILVGAGLQSIPASVGHLVLLRLLDISYNEIKELPGSIGNLTSLECLSVFGCTKLAALQRVS